MLRWKDRRLRMAWAVATIVFIGSSSPLAAFGEEITDPLLDTTVTDPVDTTVDPVTETTVDPVDQTIEDGTDAVSDTTSDATTVEGDTSLSSTDVATDDGAVLTDPSPSPDSTGDTVIGTTDTSVVEDLAPSDTTPVTYLDTTTDDAAVTTTASSPVFLVEESGTPSAVSAQDLPWKLQDGSVGAPVAAESRHGEVAAMLADTQNAEVRGSAQGKAPVVDTEAPGLCPGAGGLVCALALGTDDPGSLTTSVSSILHQLAFTGSDALALVKVCLMLAAAGAVALRIGRRSPVGSFAGMAMVRAFRGWFGPSTEM